MALKIEIGPKGTANQKDVTANVKFQTIAYEGHQEIKGSTFTFAMNVYSDEIPPPLAGQEVIFTDGSTVEFGGSILRVDRRQGEGGNRIRYDVSCVDYTWLLDRRHLNKVYDSATVDAMMKEMLDDLQSAANNDSADGDDHYDDFQGDKTQIKVGPTIKQQRIERMSPSQAFDLISSSAGMEWFINPDKQVVLFDVGDNPASPLPLNSNGERELNVETNVDDFRNLVESEDISSIGTRSVIRDALIKSTSSEIETFTAVGNLKGPGSTLFRLSKRPFSFLDITSVTLDTGGGAAAVTLKLDGIARDFNNDDASGTSPVECYVYVGPSNQNGSSYVRFSSSDIASTDVVVVTYNYADVDDHQGDDFEGREEIEDRTGGDGVHEFIFSQASEIMVEDIETLDDITQIIFARKRKILRTGTFNSFTKGWRAGDQFIFNWPTEALKYEAYVISVRKTILSPADDAAFGSDSIVISDITFSNIPHGVRI